MKTFLYLSFLIGFFATSAASATSLTSLRATNPTDNEYEILQKFYEAADRAASFADLDVIENDKSNMKCAIAWSKSDGTSSLFERVSKYHYAYVPAVPSKGPLFPGKPAKKRWVLMFQRIFEHSGLVKSLAAAQETSVTDRDLIVSITALPDGLVDQGKPWQMAIRKNGELLSFKWTGLNANNQSYQRYGYCWRE